MAKKVFGVGILALVLVFGFSVIGCDSGSDDNGGIPSGLVGTWTFTETEDGETFTQTVVLRSNNTFETQMNGTDFMRGTFSTNGNNMTITTTEIHGSIFDDHPDLNRWFNRTQMRAAMIEMGWPAAEVDEELAEMFASQTVRFTLSNNTLTIHDPEFGDQVFTRG